MRGRARGDGRRAEDSGWLLLTNATTVAPACRIRDGAQVYDVVGAPWPVYGRAGVDHYEATLKLVNG